MVWVPTEVKGKLAEHDPIPKEIPIFLPKQILSYLLMDIQLEIDMDEIKRFWAHAKRFNLPWADASHDGLHVNLHGDQGVEGCQGTSAECVICTRCTSHCTEFCPAGFSLRPSLFNSELPQGTLPGSTLGDLGFSMLFLSRA